MKKMKMLLLGVIVLSLVAGISMAKIQQRDCDPDPDCCVCIEFVDADGDGFCDYCDGCIPNPPKDGTGRKKGKS